MNVVYRLFILLSLWLAAPLLSWAQEQFANQSPSPLYLARIDQNSPAEVEAALMRAEQLYLNGQLKGAAEPVVFILHGPEVSIFFKDQYQLNQSLLDLAKRLTSLDIVDIRVCETRMGVMGRSRLDLVSFVGTVPFGPSAAKELLADQGYVHF